VKQNGGIKETMSLNVYVLNVEEGLRTTVAANFCGDNQGTTV